MTEESGVWLRSEILVDGIVFPECPRWHDGKLWFVDMFGMKVMRVDPDGQSLEVVAELPDNPSGLGFLPNGTAIVGQMRRRQIIEVESGTVHADLGPLGGIFLSDMVVDSNGRTFVDLIRAEEDGGHVIVRVDVDGTFDIASSDGVHEPNGCVITPDRAQLIVGMGHGEAPRELVAYTIDDKGYLSNRHVFADVGTDPVDGICLDEAGRVWVSRLSGGRFERVDPGGGVTATVDVAGKWGVACMLGGADRRTLFMATVIPPANPQISIDGNMHECRGFIESVTVDVPGAGYP
jgi:sugar lactone lactonase YvrE